MLIRLVNLPSSPITIRSCFLCRNYSLTDINLPNVTSVGNYFLYFLSKRHLNVKNL